MGSNAGYNNTTGHDNVYIDNPGPAARECEPGTSLL